MAKTNYQSIDGYINTFPLDIQNILQTVRQTIRKAVPEAEEVISYQIPAFKYHGFVVYFSAFAHHFSISCPPPTKIFEVFKEELEPYKASKAAIQFPLDKPVPVKLIGDIAAFKAKENTARAALK